ncbi:hypothetical protein SIFV0016 [Sulfolobus islandicus filamentous virus]|uniref:Uncharacterized protein 16 n=1 Tax=Sulfolobus islandicus filamentous virus (isolate Iceland/Hveragerdi) TaxID=654908 RepID=Y016_SIFVH|nr:hypothetical protein SIFV0016 [Sulfolobus islandicus filamentous virus]Q914L4.1 RecName: Full=Uncharacterized protein 16 [Sulfolobus islandicus filamentous virus (isolate Hveragerdi)]AAL27727.1 ribonuclease T1-related protein [Sulfolobus islandicus filamentous virus]
MYIFLMYGLEVKQLKLLYNLPKVFLTPNLNKFSITRNYVDCAYYESRSGLTREGCIIFDGNVHRTRGIYYIPVPSAVELSYRRKMIKDEQDVKQIIEKINLYGATLNTNKLLVKWNNYEIILYDRFIKGGMYEFPLLFSQGHLYVYNIPRVREAYRIIYENDNQKEEIDSEMFEEINEFSVYNHAIKFDKKVLKLKELYVSPGQGVVIYTLDDVTLVSESPDHNKIEKFVYKNSWILFSHRAPRNQDQRD